MHLAFRFQDPVRFFLFGKQKGTVPLLAFLFCCVLSAVAVGEEQAVPYRAFINADGVYVRSGPGTKYYPTDKLDTGREVEVYGRDANGWCAIKPPEGSFSWISGRFLRPAVDDLAVVDGREVAARVGSRYSTIRDVIQVRLHDAEVVEVLGKVESVADPEDPVWYKIAPPSGEFRWVSAEYLSASDPREGLPGSGLAELASFEADAAADEAVETTDEVPLAETGDRDLTDEVPRGYEPAVPREMTPEEFQAQLHQIDLELSIMVAEEPTVWVFDEMQRRAESLLAQSMTAPERGRARTLINKLAQFAEIKYRHDMALPSQDGLERRIREVAAPRPQDPQAEVPEAPKETGPEEVDDRFDGIGELIRVESASGGAPRYALVDGSGGIDCYVSPAPGVPLSHYVGRRIGVTGTRGYVPERKALHVMAQHVSPLDDDSRLR